jgi:hypothetical protein
MAPRGLSLVPRPDPAEEVEADIDEKKKEEEKREREMKKKKEINSKKSVFYAVATGPPRHRGEDSGGGLQNPGRRTAPLAGRKKISPATATTAQPLPRTATLTPSIVQPPISLKTGASVSMRPPEVENAIRPLPLPLPPPA